MLHEVLDMLGIKRLKLQKRLRNFIKQGPVLFKKSLGLLIGMIDQILDFVINFLSGVFGVVL